MAISKRTKRTFICGGSSNSISPRNSSSLRSCSSSSSVEARSRFRIFHRLRMFFYNLRERFRLRKRMRSNSLKVKHSLGQHRHHSVIKVPSLSIILETAEMKEENGVASNYIGNGAGRNLKAAFAELDSDTEIGHTNMETSDQSETLYQDNKSEDNMISPGIWSSSAEGSSDNLYSDHATETVEKSSGDFNQCSSAVFKTKETTSGLSYFSNGNRPHFKQIQNRIKRMEVTSKGSTFTPHNISSVETIDDTTDYPRSSSSEELININFFTRRDNINRNMGRKSQRGNSEAGYQKCDEAGIDCKKKVRSKRVHFSQERIVIDANRSEFKKPVIPDEFLISKSPEKFPAKTDNIVWRFNEASSSDSNSDTDMQREKMRKERNMRSKVHPAVAKMSFSKHGKANTRIDKNIVLPESSENSETFHSESCEKKVKAINMDPENSATLTPFDRMQSDDTTDNLRELKSVARDIIQQKMTNSFDIVEKVSAMKQELYSPRHSCFNLFDDDIKRNKKNLVRDIITEVKRNKNGGRRTNKTKPGLYSHSDDEASLTEQTLPSGDVRKTGPSLYMSDYDSVHTMDYETDESDMDMDNLLFDRSDKNEKEPHNEHSGTTSALIGWEQDEDLAVSLSAYTASISGGEQMSVYHKSSQIKSGHGKSNRIIVHDPRLINKKPIRYPVPEPRETTLPPSPFPLNKQKLPSVGNPQRDQSGNDHGKSKKQKSKHGHITGVENGVPLYAEPSRELGLLKEVTNRWEPTPSIFLDRHRQEHEDDYIRKPVEEPLAPIDGSRRSPVADDVLFPNRLNVENNQVCVYTQPIGKLHSRGRDSSGINISCFIHKISGGDDIEKELGNHEHEDNCDKNSAKENIENLTNEDAAKNCIEKSDEQSKKSGRNTSEKNVEVLPEHMAQYHNMLLTFQSRDTELPDAKFWMDLNKGNFKDAIGSDPRVKTSYKRHPKTAWETTETSVNISHDSSKDKLSDELDSRSKYSVELDTGSKSYEYDFDSKPLAPIGYEESNKITYDEAKENFKFFKRVALVDPKEDQRKDIQTDIKVLKTFQKTQKPLSPIENVLPEEKSSATENMYFFKNVATNPDFWSENVVPREKRPKRYIPKPPLKSINTTPEPAVSSEPQSLHIRSPEHAAHLSSAKPVVSSETLKSIDTKSPEPAVSSSPLRSIDTKSPEPAVSSSPLRSIDTKSPEPAVSSSPLRSIDTKSPEPAVSSSPLRSIHTNSPEPTIYTSYPEPAVTSPPLKSIHTNSPEHVASSPADNMEFFRSVAKFPHQFYDVSIEDQKNRPYFLEAPVGSTKDNAGRRHSREDENLNFFKCISNNQQFFEKNDETEEAMEQKEKPTDVRSTKDSNFVDPITAEENMRFFQHVSRSPNIFYKTKESEEAINQMPRRKKSEIPDDPSNYVDDKTAQENMEFFRKHAKKAGLPKK